jgi:hypothetical protein
VKRPFSNQESFEAQVALFGHQRSVVNGILYLLRAETFGQRFQPLANFFVLIVFVPIHAGQFVGQLDDLAIVIFSIVEIGFALVVFSWELPIRFESGNIRGVLIALQLSSTHRIALVNLQVLQETKF